MVVLARWIPGGHRYGDTLYVGGSGSFPSDGFSIAALYQACGGFVKF